MAYTPTNQATHHKQVPNPQNSTDTLQVGDSLGSFVGYLRRPKSTSAGLVAQFFGENGEDADVISALHLTRFLDAHVKVSVWMIKNRVGKLMRTQDGGYQKVTEFIATIRRPQPSNLGQVAHFFGENGPNADAINVLNHSEYLDALVYVEMHQAVAGMAANDLFTDSPDDALTEKSKRMTSSEMQEFKKVQKRAQEGIRMLEMHGFFRNEAVLAVLGREQDYIDWLTTQPCCHPGEHACQNQQVTAWRIPGTRRNAFVPLCLDHVEMWESGNVTTPDGSNALAFVQTQNIYYLQRWARYALNKNMNIQQDNLPTPASLYTWAVDKKLHGHIPSSFKALMG